MATKQLKFKLRDRTGALAVLIFIVGSVTLLVSMVCVVLAYVLSLRGIVEALVNQTPVVGSNVFNVLTFTAACAFLAVVAARANCAERIRQETKRLKKQAKKDAKAQKNTVLPLAR
jgi:glycerol-3-phosphate acyltransferase PlsY